ncbi:hypothetical protein VTN77DRAFT_9367 [Rasamsonia byssochlamydoides]|uniref:uncharacterized protein n=1 Tax=Rasamsonia byssochlamydoides TaxID=89139 RepID=UPI0037445BE1
MNQVTSYDFEDWPDWPLRNSQRVSCMSSATQDSETASLLSLSQFPPPPSPTVTSTSDKGKSPQSPTGEVIRLDLNPSVTISFARKSRLFRIQYGYINICKDASGNLRCLELGGSVGQQSPFVHSFNNSKLPVPHLEQPRLSNETSYRVSFLEEQTVQTAQTVFTSQLSYTFDDWDDCVRFQEILLASELVFIAGIAEAKSKGRGEECISQNLRVLRGRHDRKVILFFANSQRRERKKYVSIPLNCIDHLDVPKKASRPVSLHLRPNFEILAEMKVLHIQFLEENEREKFTELVLQNINR